MSALKLHKKLELVSIVTRKGTAEGVIAAAQAAGGLFGIIYNARASIRHGNKRWLRRLSINPEMEQVVILTSKKSVNGVMEQAIRVSGIDHNAIGAVQEMPLSRAWAVGHIQPPTIGLKKSQMVSGAKLQSNLRLITCICQQGKAEAISDAAVREGSAAPIINFGEGKGVRDRMGLLKIAVNPVKEIIQVVVDEMECDRIFDAMVDEGKLYAPGMGFIYTTDIPSGFINLHTTLSTSHTGATVEQIIKAIDELKASKNWRLADVGFTAVRRHEHKQLLDLVNLKLVTRRGLGDEFIYHAMQAGAQGATRVYARLIGGETLKSVTGRVISDERELIDFHVAPAAVPRLINSFDKLLAEHKSRYTFVLELPVPRVVTYFG